MDNFEYDEDLAIDYIRKYVGDKISDQYSDDEILYVIDIMWDYYERKGFTKLNANLTDNEALDEADLVNYVKKELANDREILMDPGDVGEIIKGELAYEESLEEDNQ